MGVNCCNNNINKGSRNHDTISYNQSIAIDNTKYNNEIDQYSNNDDE